MQREREAIAGSGEGETRLLVDVVMDRCLIGQVLDQSEPHRMRQQDDDEAGDGGADQHDDGEPRPGIEGAGLVHGARRVMGSSTWAPLLLVMERMVERSPPFMRSWGTSMMVAISMR